jgi:preprotein translocase subunit SecG
MDIFSVLAVGFLINFAAVAFVICALVLILVILIQRGRGGGLSSAFGGGGAGGIMGSKTGDFLTWVTIVLVALFLTLAVLMAKFYRPSVSDFDEQQPIEQSQPIEQTQSPQSDNSGTELQDENPQAQDGQP